MSTVERRHATNFKRGLTNYFRLTALEDNVTFTISKGSNVKTTYFTYLEYSINEGVTWNRINNTNSSSITVTIPDIRLGDSVLFRGSGNTLSSSTSTATGYFTWFKSNKKFKVSGVLMTLLKGKWADENTPMGTSLCTFKLLFTDQANLIDASDLIFPPNVTNYCYSWMFYKCTNLTKGPTLPALILANNCYLYMFFNCTKLTYIRMLATNISASACLSNWFPATQTNLEFHHNPEATWLVTGASGIPLLCVLFDDTEELDTDEVTFIDPEVQRIALAWWGNRKPVLSVYNSTNTDWKNNIRIGGILGKILKRQIKNVVRVRALFALNTLIQDMSDFNLFEGLINLGTGGLVAGHGFYGCTNLVRITLPSTLTNLCLGYSYSKGCFTNCRSLQRLYMPDSITTFNSSCFYNCTSLTYVRYSSNCPFPAYSGSYNNEFFYNCSNLEEIENFPKETTTWITANAFRGCSKLDFSSVLDFNKLVRIGGYGLNGGTNWPSEIVFSSLTNISENFALNFGNNCAVDKIYMPKVTNLGGQYSHLTLARLLDFGNVTGGRLSTYHFANAVNSDANDITIILRSKTVPNLTGISSSTRLKRLYIYSSILDSFKTTYSAIASKTLPIGGEQWATEFGSYYEYADYPLSDPFTFNESTDSSMFIEYPMYNPLVSLTLRFNDSNYRSIVIPISKVKWEYTRMGGTEFREITGVTATVDGEGNLSGFTVLTAAVSGDLTPNKPYIVTTGMNGDGNGLYPEIIHSNGVVEATTPITDEFTSNGYKFSFTGTYETITDMEGKYAFNGTNWVLCTSSDTMKPTYVYMEVTKIEE